MAPGIRPRRPLKKGGAGSATGPPATARGAPPAYQDQTSPAGGGAALSGAACSSRSHPRSGNRGRHTHAPSLAAPVLLGRTPRGRCRTPRGLRDTREDKEKVPQWRPQRAARGLQDATPCG